MTLIEKILFEFYSQLLLQVGFCLGGVKHWPKSTWGNDGFISCYTYKPLLREARTQNRNSGKDHGKQNCLLACLLPLACLATLLKQSRLTCPGMTSHTVARALLLQTVFKKMSHRHSHKPIQCRQHFNWSFLFLGGSQWQHQLTMTTVFNYAILGLNIFTRGESGSLCAQGQFSL